MIRRPPRSTQSRSSAASDVYKRQLIEGVAVVVLAVVVVGVVHVVVLLRLFLRSSCPVLAGVCMVMVVGTVVVVIVAESVMVPLVIFVREVVARKYEFLAFFFFWTAIWHL